MKRLRPILILASLLMLAANAAAQIPLTPPGAEKPAERKPAAKKEPAKAKPPGPSKNPPAPSPKPRAAPAPAGRDRHPGACARQSQCRSGLRRLSTRAVQDRV